jgi:ribosomal protein L15
MNCAIIRVLRNRKNVSDVVLAPEKVKPPVAAIKVRSPVRVDYEEVSLARLQTAIDAGKLDVSAIITANELVAAGVIKKPGDGVRLLANGELTAKVDLEIAGASKNALAAVEKAGGSIKILAAPAQENSSEKASK